MDLYGRLVRLRAMQQTDTPAAPSLAHDGTSSPPLEALVEGRWESRLGARCFVSEHTYPLMHRHGALPLGAWLEIPAEPLRPFVTGAVNGPMQRRTLLFLDIETTGLARGAGTYAFLVGVGSFRDEAFCTRQFFMPDYGSEAALLDLVAHELSNHLGLVSFNGRTFDWPILQTRYVLARSSAPFSGEPHLDLLHLSRRLWRQMLPSCALSSLETHILGVRRTDDDVPGYLIPGLYQDYVRLGRTEPIAKVFYHNLLDLLSMVTLAGRAGLLLSDPKAAEVQDCCDNLALGRLFEQHGDTEAAIAAYERAGDPAVKPLSFLLKRMGRYEEAMALWHASLGKSELYPYVELAKQYEHRLRDPKRARSLVLAALKLLEQDSKGDVHADRRELQHRLTRLERRLQTAP